MLGHSRIGDCVTKSGLFAAGGSPFMMQDIGGAITRACAALHPRPSVRVISCACDLERECVGGQDGVAHVVSCRDIAAICVAFFPRWMASDIVADRAVFPTATFHAITCSEIYAEDVVKPCSYQDPHAGFVRV